MKTEKEKCPRFDYCSTALCPRDPHPRRYWYADTEICKMKNPPKWVKTQKRIQEINPDPHSYYTQKMLESVTRVTKDITGISFVGYYKSGEDRWIHDRGNREVNHGHASNMGNKAGFGGENQEAGDSLGDTNTI
jgi:hypothetical protein